MRLYGRKGRGRSFDGNSQWVLRFWKGVIPIPKLQREATLLLSTAELSKSLGIPFDKVESVDWWTDERNMKVGLRLRVRTEEEISVKGQIEAGEVK